LKILYPINTTHTITLQPRFNPSGVFSLYFDNVNNYPTDYSLQDGEGNDLLDGLTNILEVTPAQNTYTYINGVLNITFDLTVLEGDRFSLKVVEDGVVIYRGKIFCTGQDSEDYKLTKNKYIYV
jgi:hypothetical protein